MMNSSIEQKMKALSLFLERQFWAPPPSGLNNHKKKALVVDDDSGSRNRLKDFLHQQGYECEEVCDAFAAMRWLDKNHADLVTTDIHQGWCMEENGKWLPRPTGLEMLEYLARKPGRKKPNMIVMSGSLYYSPTYSKRAKKAGAKGLFSKPYNEKELLELV